MKHTSNECECDACLEDAPKLKRYPEPTYPYCNAGHRLVQMFNERLNAIDWDCPTCIEKIQRVRT